MRAPAVAQDRDRIGPRNQRGIGGALAAAFGRWRRGWSRRGASRRDDATTSGEPAPSWDALRAVVRLIDDEEELDRETLMMFAENDGHSADDIGRAIDQWIRAGRLRVEPEPDGFERLVWLGPEPAGSALGGRA
jgi:hypothetical protein